MLENASGYQVPVQVSSSKWLIMGSTLLCFPVFLPLRLGNKLSVILF